MLLLDLSHTCHTQARTGIQRVSRSLHAGLGATAEPVTYDPYLRSWRRLAPWERENLAANGSAGVKRGAHWPWATRFTGKWRRKLGWGPAAALRLPPKRLRAAGHTLNLVADASAACLFDPASERRLTV